MLDGRVLEASQVEYNLENPLYRERYTPAESYVLVAREVELRDISPQLHSCQSAAEPGIFLFETVV